jgi:aminomethyltransferase
VTSNDASTLTVGKAQYSCLPNDQGGIVDDLLIYKLKEEAYLLVVNASNIDKDWDWISSHNDVKAEMENVSIIHYWRFKGPVEAMRYPPLI